MVVHLPQAAEAEAGEGVDPHWPEAAGAVEEEGADPHWLESAGAVVVVVEAVAVPRQK